jgi:hypothetical protein
MLKRLKSALNKAKVVPTSEEQLPNVEAKSNEKIDEEFDEIAKKF